MSLKLFARLGFKKADFLFLGIMIALTLSGWIAYGIYGHRLISAMYDGKATGVFHGIIEAQSKFPVEYYFEKAEKVLIILSVFFIAASIYLYFLLSKLPAIFYIIKQCLLKRNESGFKLRTSLQAFLIIRSNVFTAILLFILFFSVYYYWGTEFASTRAFSIDSILFQADIPQAIHDITDVNANHSSRVVRHPLYSLFVHPVGSFLSNFMDKTKVVLVLNSGFGGFGVAFAFVLLGVMSIGYLNNLLICLCFGFSMSQLFFGAAPETYSLSLLSLLFTYLLLITSLQQKKNSLALWILAGVFSLGVTTTNFMQTLICFCLSVWNANSGKREAENIIPHTLVLISSTFACTAILLVFQQVIFARTFMGAAPQEFLFNVDQTNLSLFESPVLVAFRVVKHFFAFNIVGPVPAVYQAPHTQLPALSFDIASGFSAIGYMALFLWIAVLAMSLKEVVKVKSDGKNDFIWPILLCFLFNLIFHLFYGAGESERPELFLYSCNYTFLLILLTSVYTKLHSKFVFIHLTILGFCLVVNNLSLMNGIVKIYR